MLGHSGPTTLLLMSHILLRHTIEIILVTKKAQGCCHQLTVTSVHDRTFQAIEHEQGQTSYFSLNFIPLSSSVVNEPLDGARLSGETLTALMLPLPSMPVLTIPSVVLRPSHIHFIQDVVGHLANIISESTVYLALRLRLEEKGCNNSQSTFFYLNST